MRNRLFQQKDIYNNREYVLKSRAHQGDCLWCYPNHNENRRGHKSKWGRKVASRRQYTTGKGRKEIDWTNQPYWDLWDEHYERRNKNVKHDLFLVWECS